ncbi:hypothetical protein MBANPS3_001761 [Mucor bainieri]
MLKSHACRSLLIAKPPLSVSRPVTQTDVPLVAIEKTPINTTLEIKVEAQEADMKLYPFSSLEKEGNDSQMLTTTDENRPELDSHSARIPQTQGE